MKQLGMVLLGVSLVVGCASRGSRAPGGGVHGDDAGPGTGIDSGTVTPRPDGSVPPPMTGDQCTKMDVLFVIDDSGSMAEEQTNLATNFPLFVDVLEAYRTETGEPLDYRLGVTTTGTDVTIRLSFPPEFMFPPMDIMESGPEGALLTGSGCGMSRPWIERSDGDVASKFACVAQVGTSGSGIEMPLWAVELALTERVADGSNAGFLREDALLAVVILSDENDCSRTDDPIEMMLADPFSGGGAAAADECDPSNPMIEPVPRFLGVLDTVTGDRGRWAAAVIAGPGPGTCSSEFGDAIEATRLKDFVTMAGENAVFSSICDGDLSSSLTRAIETFQAACESFPPLI
jgi:hypothetical protein